MKDKLINLINSIQSDEVLFTVYNFIISDMLKKDICLSQFKIDEKANHTFDVKSKLINAIAMSDNQEKIEFLYAIVKEFLL